MNAADRQPRPTPTPDDWTDTEESKRAEAFVEYLSRDVGYNLRHYASPHASPHASHRMGEGCQCRPSRIPHVGLAAPESARPATLAPERPVKAPGQDGDSQRPSGPVLPRRIDPEDVRVGMLVERRKGETYLGGRVKNIEEQASRIETDGGVVAWSAIYAAVRDWSLWLIEDAPEPVDPDSEAADADTEDAVYLSGPMTGLPDFNRPAFHAAAAALREQGYVVINPAEVDLGPDATWADYMRIHLAEIARRVTRVFVLPGWESSRGAQLEVHVARSLGLPVVPAPTPEDPDAAVIEAIITAYRRSPECSTHSVFGEAMLDNLRAQGFDVTARAEQ